VVLVAFVLVLLAAASFAVGIAASRTSDTLVYLSIFFSLGAFVTLAIASFRARQAERDAPAGDRVTTPMRSIEETEAHAGPLLGGLDPTQLDLTPSWRRKSERRPAPDPVFDEFEDEALDDQLENEEDEADFEVPVEPVAVRAPVDEFRWGLHDADEEPTATFTPSLHDDDVDEDDELDIPEPEPETESELTAEGSFFDEYDDLTAAEILPFLRALDLEGLKWVRARERSGAKRATVVNQVEQLILDHGGRPSTASTRKKTTAKKAAAKKAAAKKAAAKKAAPARRTVKKSTRRR